VIVFYKKKMSFSRKKYRTILLLFLPVIIAIIVYSRWDSWFYNPPEPHYSSSKNPERILLTWSGDPCTTRNVTWQCDTISKYGKLSPLRKVAS